MFIYSIKAGTVRFVAVIVLSIAVLLALAAFVEPIQAVNAEDVEVINYAKIKTEDDRKEFLSQFGWKTAGDAVEIVEYSVPAEFDRVLLGYNEIQKSQGLDLGRYCKKKVTRYTYEISNYDGYEGKVYANVIVYKNKVIAGDICSADPYGFVHGFEKRS